MMVSLWVDSMVDYWVEYLVGLRVVSLVVY